MSDNNYNGQFGEDKWIVEHFNLPETGWVIDIGADQPIYGSNTYYFEHNLGWNGICVDADERVIPKLKEERKNVEYCAISSYDGTIKFNPVNVAGISHISKNFGSKEIPCMTATTLFKKYNVDNINLLSIDVEGHELDVCRGIDWERYLPLIVVVEFVSPQGDIYYDLKNYFSSLPYDLVHKSQANLIYCSYKFKGNLK